jgi:hypothetical protein
VQDKLIIHPTGPRTKICVKLQLDMSESAQFVQSFIQRFLYEALNKDVFQARFPFKN